MKIHRLLSIVIYLLNHETASTRVLAEKFEVSRRTIQRDIDTINLAGIPIVSTYGSQGGYGIIEGYKLDRQLTDSDDYIFIITALKGLYSALNDSKIDKTLEKLLTISPSQTVGKQTIFLDFSVLGEKNNVSEYIRLVKHAIEKKSVIEFEYTDADSHLTHRLVEPVALTYKWYNWYVFAFCRTKEDYRLFKLSRITNLTSTRIQFSRVHGNPEELMNKHDSMNPVRCLDVKLLCKASIRVAVLEYLNGRIAKELDNGDFILELHVPENERMWFSLLLSFGNEVKVLEPSTLKDRLVEKSKETIDLYLVNSDI